jgi:hypothetical protein
MSVDRMDQANAKVHSNDGRVGEDRDRDLLELVIRVKEMSRGAGGLTNLKMFVDRRAHRRMLGPPKREPPQSRFDRSTDNATNQRM